MHRIGHVGWNIFSLKFYCYTGLGVLKSLGVLKVVMLNCPKPRPKLGRGLGQFSITNFSIKHIRNYVKQ